MKVLLIAVTSIDGFIAQDPNVASTSWTSPEDTQWFNERTKQARLVVMGRKSFATVPEKYRPLSHRVNIIYSSNKTEVEQMVREPVLELTEDMAPQQFKQLIDQSENNKPVFVTSLEPQQLVKLAAAAGFAELALCGGSSLYSLFMNAGVVDTLLVTIEPHVFGNGVKLFSEMIQPPNDNWQLKKVHHLSDQTILLEYTRMIND